MGRLVWRSVSSKAIGMMNVLLLGIRVDPQTYTEPANDEERFCAHAIECQYSGPQRKKRRRRRKRERDKRAKYTPKVQRQVILCNCNTDWIGRPSNDQCSPYVGPNRLGNAPGGSNSVDPSHTDQIDQVRNYTDRQVGHYDLCHLGTKRRMTRKRTL